MIRPSTQLFRFEQLATSRNLIAGQYLWNLQQHLEPETRAQHRRASRARHNVTATHAIEIKLVGQVVEIELQIDVLRNRIRSHQIKRPIRVDETCVDGVAEALIHKPRTTTEMKTGRQTVGGPDVEGIPRSVDQFFPDLCGNV